MAASHYLPAASVTSLTPKAATPAVPRNAVVAISIFLFFLFFFFAFHNYTLSNALFKLIN
jgi:hypothetical protein